MNRLEVTSFESLRFTWSRAPPFGRPRGTRPAPPVVFPEIGVEPFEVTWQTKSIARHEPMMENYTVPANGRLFGEEPSPSTFPRKTGLVTTKRWGVCKRDRTGARK